MLGALGKLFDSNEKEIRKLQPIVSEVNSFEEKLRKLKTADFAKKTKEFKERVVSGESLDLILPEAFALVREAAHRSIGQRHYDVQLMAGASLSMGKIAEQKTGEGKTLSAVPALYLHALTGKAVHLVTVNDYLARRDAGWMGPVFKLLGMSVSSIISEQSFIFDPDFTNKEAHDFRLTHLRPVTRKEAYLADVVYGINSEYGFDYLRDNMQQDLGSVVQRGYYFGVVDEVDSVLIDEARTPHIISAPDETPTNKYYEYAKLVDKLSSDIDYKIDEKLHTAHLTDHGLGKIEKLFGIQNIYEKDFDTVYHIEAALKARTLFHKEKDYIVKDGEVILVDEFTGRLMIGRRLSEGLHQAIEAKEGVVIQRESKTLATVSLQNYFRMYDRLAGMTGTALTEAQEFHKIYNLDVIVIPTNKATKREDFSDAIYKSGRAKFSAVVTDIDKAHKAGQPVLVGTTSIEKNEILSELLRRHGIKHELLNAKNHEREAEIIAKAGEKGAVTVATNMAGRGVDIILGGEAPVNDDGTEKRGTKEWDIWQKRHDEVLSLGGLYVIGTERHESRRIDNQLRGRSGRQGDPGKSRFYVALDDEIMRLFGGDSIAGLMTRFNMPEDVPLEHPIVSRAIEQAQVKVEGFNFDRRKQLVQYDDVLNKQREIIYARRRKILENAADEKKSSKEQILENINSSISQIVSTAEIVGDGKSPAEKIVSDFSTIIPFDPESQKQLVKQIEATVDINARIEFLNKIAENLYEQREKQVGEKTMRQVENFVTLSVIDNLWMDHLDVVDNLREGIGLRAYGQKDPLVEYKNEAFRMFETLINGIDDEIAHRIFKVQIATPEHQHTHVHEQPAGGELGADEAPQIANSKKQIAKSGNGPSLASASSTQTSSSSISAGLSSDAPASGPGTGKNKIGRNDPCWCGSGKKYKRCHYPN
ncbi:MAG: preprotein translocase subunit SecA [Candidatus Levybacteria bacterium]|nr:preprotein translocase subunit SecA [Candidatus Levybacteria bacterium]